MNTRNDSGFKTFKVGSGGVTVYTRVKLSSGEVVAAGAGEDCIGTVLETVAEDGYAAVKLLTASGTHHAIAAGTFAVDAVLYGAAAGKVDDVVSGDKQFIALEAATAANQRVEVLPVAPASVLAVQSLISDPNDITDNSGGTDPEDQTIPAMTNTDALTDSTGGSANTTLAAVTQQAGGAGVELTDGDAAKINDNFADIAAQLAKQKTLNTALINAVAQIAAEHNASNAVIAALIDAGQANGLIATS